MLGFTIKHSFYGLFSQYCLTKGRDRNHYKNLKKKILRLTTIKASPRTDNKLRFEDGCLAVTLNCQIFQLPHQ